MFTSNKFIVYVQTLLSDIIYERKYKINDGDRINYDFSSGQVQKNLGAVVEKFRELVTKSGANITLPQSGNLADQLRNLTRSGGFKKLTQLLPELSQLGINETAIKNLQQKGGTDLPGIVQKLKDLLQAIP